MPDSGRQADLDYLLKMRRSASRGQIKEIDEAIEAIANESGLIRSMRERLIKEMRAGRPENVRDIHEYIKNKQRYNNE